jgi:hypothetical protein
VKAKAAQDAQGRRQAGSPAECGDGRSGGTPIGVGLARSGVDIEPKCFRAERIALCAAVLTLCGWSAFWIVTRFLVACTSVVGCMSGLILRFNYFQKLFIRRCKDIFEPACQRVLDRRYAVTAIRQNQPKELTSRFIRRLPIRTEHDHNTI